MSQFIEMFASSDCVPLNSLATLSKSSVLPKEGITYTLYSFPAFDNNQTPEVVDGGEIKSSKIVLEDNVVLFNKLNVRLARVWNISSLTTLNNVCSSEFLPLKVKEPNVISQSFLYRILSSDFVTKKMMDCSTGTSNSQKRIAPSSLMNLRVPLPPKDDQQMFVAIAEQADKSEFDGLKSQFIEMFTNNNFEMVPLGDLCDKISDGSHNPPKGIENSKYLMISSKNVFKDHLDLTDVRYLTEEDFEVENKRTNVKANDVLLTIVGTIGRTYLVKGDEGNLVMQRSVAVLTPNSRVTPLFLMFYLHSDKNLEKEGRGNAQKGIYLKQLSQYEIKVPSIDLQKQFEAIYRQADKSESVCHLSIHDLINSINYN